MSGGVGLKRKNSDLSLTHKHAYMYVYTNKHSVSNSPTEAGGSPGLERDVRGLLAYQPVNILQCGLWVLSLGLSQRNTSLVVSMATSQFPWNGKVCDGLEPEWAFWLHVCAVRGFGRRRHWEV